MQPGAVIVDVAIDQGGCVETIHATTHENPTYVVDGIIHYGVANMPGGVPRTSTLALTNATFPYALQLANKGGKRRSRQITALRLGLNMVEGKVTYPGVAEAFGMPLTDVESVCDLRGPVTDVLVTSLPHAEGLPLPSPGHPGLGGVRRGERRGRHAGPAASGGCSAPASRSPCPRASSARSGHAPAWRSSTASRCPTRRPRIDSDYAVRS